MIDLATPLDPYDDVPYSTHAHSASHPDRLATIASLMGLAPAPVARCRVLELGCGDGANLIALAAALPESEFVGCDLASRPIASAREFSAELRLANVGWLQHDLREIPAPLRPFDYIIAHGVYSWVPAPVRDAMMAVIARNLAPNGVAFVSYNVYPGCYQRRMAWEILKFHVEEVQEPRARIAEARALIALIADPANKEQPTNAGLRQEFRRLAEQTDSALFHDDLAPINEPVYFHEFIANAAQRDLQFLAEAEFPMMTDADVAPAVQNVLSTMDALGREQYLDFVRGRRFRQTLLCHAALTPDRMIVPDRVARLFAVAPKIVTRSGIAFPAPESEPSLSSILNADLAEAAVMREIAAAWPRPVSVAALARSFRGSGPRRGDDGTVPLRLAKLLLGAFGSGAVELHSHVPSLAVAAGAHPTASPLARAQAARTDRVTNLWHESVALDEARVRQLLMLLDGTRDRTELLVSVGAAFAGDPAATPAELLERYLTHCARMALLVA